jgi:hypothetical protein
VAINDYKVNTMLAGEAIGQELKDQHRICRFYQHDIVLGFW